MFEQKYETFSLPVCFFGESLNLFDRNISVICCAPHYWEWQVSMNLFTLDPGRSFLNAAMLVGEWDLVMIFRNQEIRKSFAGIYALFAALVF